MPLDGPIIIADYDAAWPGLFHEHEAAMQRALGGRIALIEHIGSTAVPGLAAKAIIDVIIGHTPPGVDDTTVAAMTELGYDYHGNFGVPGRGFFRLEPKSPTDPAVHVHIFPEGHPSLARDISFRNSLRSDPDLAHRYAVLKRTLAAMYRNDLDAYNLGKEGFITQVAGARPAPAAWETPRIKGPPERGGLD